MLARIAVADRQLFLQLVLATATAKNVDQSQIWEPILNQWWQRVIVFRTLFCTVFSRAFAQFDNMSEPRHRKLAAMGIANLVATGRPEVLDRLSTEICNLWIDVFGEIKEAQENSGNECVVVLHACLLALTNISVRSSLITLYWDRPFEHEYTDSEGTLEHGRRKAVSHLLSSWDPQRF